MTTVEILRAARELISDRERWTTGSLARDGNGWNCYPNDPEACQFCALGAIAHVAGGALSSEFPDARGLLEKACGFDPARVNDTRGHEAVLAAYDRAIALAEASA